jgi:hypothetical protein
MLYPRPFLIGEEASDEKTEQEIRVTSENDAIETPGHSGETADTYGGDGGSVKEGEGAWEGPTGAIRDAFENARRGKLPDTHGGWAVLLLIGVAMIGGGWLMVRRFSSSG